MIIIYFLSLLPWVRNLKAIWLGGSDSGSLIRLHSKKSQATTEWGRGVFFQVGSYKAGK